MYKRQEGTTAEAASQEDTTEAADTSAAAGEEKDWSNVTTVSEGKLIVATEAGFAPYEYLSGDQVVGVDMDIAQAIADELGLELQIMNMDFTGCLLYTSSRQKNFLRKNCLRKSCIS